MTLPVAKKTLYLFPESVSGIILAKLNGNDSIASFPSFVLPFCRLPRGLEWDEWKQYGNDIQKLLRISTPDIEERFDLFFKTNFSDYDRIVVVHTDSVPELLFIYMVNSLIKMDLYELNLSNCSKYGTIGSIGEVAPLYFDQLFLPEKPIKISTDKRTEMELCWNRIIDNSDELRVMDSNGNIVNVGIDYLDNNMMNYCNSKYKNLNVQSCEFASTESFGLNFCSLNRFTFVRMIELAKSGKVFPYDAKTKEELSVKSLEPIDTLDSRKLLVLILKEAALERSTLRLPLRLSILIVDALVPSIPSLIQSIELALKEAALLISKLSELVDLNIPCISREAAEESSTPVRIGLETVMIEGPLISFG